MLKIVGWHATDMSIVAITAMCFVLTVSLVRVLLANVSKWFDYRKYTTESSLIIILGIFFGFFMLLFGGKFDSRALNFNPEIIFLFLIPPIILEAGYFLKKDFFFENLGLILTYAVVGTFLNTVSLAITLYSFANAGLFGEELSVIDSLLFGSLISAVDPVAVLAVFEEIHVKETLNILVFGESVLNDAMAIVLFRLFESMREVDKHSVDGSLVGYGILKFFSVSIGGLVVGVLWGLLAAFMTKYTRNLPLLEPLLVFLSSFMAYFLAEALLFSGIISILFCGIIMSRYVELNVSRKSHVTLKYGLKMLASTAETLVFVYLGIFIVLYQHEFNLSFILITLVFIMLFRFLFISGLTFFDNIFRAWYDRVTFPEQCVLLLGGLRGAIAAALSFLLPEDAEMQKEMISTTLVVIMFTVFVLGTSVRPVLSYFQLREEKHSREERENELLEEGEELLSGYNMLLESLERLNVNDREISVMPESSEKRELMNAGRELQSKVVNSVLVQVEKTNAHIMEMNTTFESTSRFHQDKNKSLKRIQSRFVVSH